MQLSTDKDSLCRHQKKKKNTHVCIKPSAMQLLLLLSTQEAQNKFLINDNSSFSMKFRFGFVKHWFMIFLKVILKLSAK